MKKIISFKNEIKYKNIILIFFLLFFYTILCAYSYVNAVSLNLQNSVFRLHVVANSDSIEDQNLKYTVRDAVLSYINELTVTATDKKDIINIVNNNIENIKEIAQKTVNDNGYDYNVTVAIGNFAFPTKKYGDIAFPSGFYDALKIEIGEADGQNWWCVMFPPLCFVDVTTGIVPEDSKNILKSSLPEEEYELISENSDDINIKFKIVELFQNLNIKLAQK